MILIGEKLSALGALGIGLVILGIYVLHLTVSSWRAFFLPLSRLTGRSSRWALYTGGTIALYSLVDKIGVANVYPAAYIYLLSVGAWILLTPYVLTNRKASFKQEWQRNKGAILIVGVLVFFTYMLVLFAMRLSKVSYVVALRESSILFSVLLGTLWLHEKHGKQKFLGAALIFVGVFLIGLSR